MTPAQRQSITAARRQAGQHLTGMVKFTVHMMDGKTFTMLSDQCATREAAILGAIERFGNKVKDVTI